MPETGFSWGAVFESGKKYYIYTFCQDQLSFPAMQVTSSHVSIWCNLLASYDEYTALVKIGNVASEHVK